MTSRSEYRLLLRQDNADLRLTPLGHEIGLIPDERYEELLEKKRQIAQEIARVENVRIRPEKDVQAFLERYNSAPLKSGTALAELIRRPELDYETLAPLDKDRPALMRGVAGQVNINIKYEGYIQRQRKQVEQFRKLENKKLPDTLDYMQIHGLRLEARQKLNQYRPASVGQASRISGVSPADISVLLIYLKSNRK